MILLYLGSVASGIVQTDCFLSAVSEVSISNPSAMCSSIYLNFSRRKLGNLFGLYLLIFNFLIIDSGNKDSLVIKKLRSNNILPVRKHTLDNDLERLSTGNGLLGEVTVTTVLNLTELRVVVKSRGRNVERTAPGHELLITVLLGNFLLVLTLESTVVTLVQTPRAVNVEVKKVGVLESNVGSLDSTGELRGEKHIRLVRELTEEFTSTSSLTAALLVELSINPTSEQVLGVPLTLTVTKQNKVFSLTSHF